VLRALARANDLAGAKALAEETLEGEPLFRPGYFAAIAGGQVEGGDVDGALATATAPNQYDRRPVLKEIVDALAAKKDFARAEQVAE
jgi:hypothetical protein